MEKIEIDALRYAFITIRTVNKARPLRTLCNSQTGRHVFPSRTSCHRTFLWHPIESGGYAMEALQGLV